MTARRILFTWRKPLVVLALLLGIIFGASKDDRFAAAGAFIAMVLAWATYPEAGRPRMPSKGTLVFIFAAGCVTIAAYVVVLLLGR